MKTRDWKCIYCWFFGKLTKEHVFTKSIVKEFFWSGWWLWYRHEKEHYSIDNQTIKNVCAKCNNEIFSEYDNKMKSFLEINFNNKLIFKWNIIEFKYDFFDLSRWILKTLYNSYEKNWYKAERNINFIYAYKDFILWQTNDVDFQCFVEVLRDPYLLEYDGWYDFQKETNEEYKKRTRTIKISNLVWKIEEKIVFIWKMLTIWDYIFDKNFKDCTEFFIRKNIVARKLLKNETSINLEVWTRTLFELQTKAFEWEDFNQFWKYYNDYIRKKYS